ncbi:hypothetical protein G8C92_22475, partial [Paenibacillus donghaensis]|nr:hypothetical protein [Paenibacillus donghaensis]
MTDQGGGDILRVVVYAIGFKGSWTIKWSLDIRVDVLWWKQQVDTHGCNGRMVFLSGAMALSQAAELEQRFDERPDLRNWDLRRWEFWLKEQLREKKESVRHEGSFFAGQAGHGITSDEDGNRELWLWDLLKTPPEAVFRLLEEAASAGRMKQRLHEAGAVDELSRQADMLTELLRGRSLLAAEVDALLQEAAPMLAGAWHSAAQLASLQGRLVLDAGLA